MTLLLLHLMALFHIEDETNELVLLVSELSKACMLNGETSSKCQMGHISALITLP